VLRCILRHCDVPVSTPRSSGFARLEFEAFCRQVPRKPRLVGGYESAQSKNNKITFPGCTALCAGSITLSPVSRLFTGPSKVYSRKDAQLYTFGLLSKDKNRPFSLGAQKKDALIKGHHKNISAVL